MRRPEPEKPAARWAAWWRGLDTAQRRFLWLAALGFLLAGLFALASLFFPVGAGRNAAGEGSTRTSTAEATE